MSYQVVVTREDGAWLADIPELEGAHTWARNLLALDHAVREVIVLAADLPDDAMPTLDLDYVYDVHDQAVRDAEVVRDRREEIHQAAQDLAAQTEETVRKLVRSGYSVRDTAVLTGVSHQRVSQLTRRRGRLDDEVRRWAREQNRDKVDA